MTRNSIGTKPTASAEGASRSYQVLPDPSAARSDYVRVVDDSGEDYLYPMAGFVPVALPESVRVALGVMA